MSRKAASWAIVWKADAAGSVIAFVPLLDVAAVTLPVGRSFSVRRLSGAASVHVTCSSNEEARWYYGSIEVLRKELQQR